jgi:hypothetical protein
MLVMRSGVCDGFSLVLGEYIESLVMGMDWTKNMPSASINAILESPRGSERISDTDSSNQIIRAVQMGE